MWSHLKTTDHNGITQKKIKKTNEQTSKLARRRRLLQLVSALAQDQRIWT